MKRNVRKPALSLAAALAFVAAVQPRTRSVGKTKQGKYMQEADAIEAGYKPAK